MARQKTILQALKEKLKGIKESMAYHKPNRGSLGCQYDYWEKQKEITEAEIKNLREYKKRMRNGS